MNFVNNKSKGDVLRVLGILFILIIRIARSDININQQSTCILLGNSLINKCVEDVSDLEECAAIYSAYYSCIIQLNFPLQVKHKREIDNYQNKTFSPCGYEISHLILHNKCY